MVHGITIDANGVSRCAWPGDDELYIEYHDKEWGYPEGNDKKLFEKISLEGFQAGLAWITILRKREHFREAFSNFDFNKISKYGEKEIQVLKSNAGIVRHEGKIRSVINNSHRAKELISEKGSLKNYFWYFSQFVTEGLYDEIPAKTSLSEAISKDLKDRGWTWVGPTTVYSFMQATGIVNDHHHECDIHKIVQSKRKSFMQSLQGDLKNL